MTEFRYTSPDGRDYSSKPLSLKQITNLLDVMPRIPKRELKCHPFVLLVLRNYTRDGEYTVHDELAALTGIQVYEDDTLGWGEWKLFEDGECVKTGYIEVQEG